MVDQQAPLHQEAPWVSEAGEVLFKGCLMRLGPLAIPRGRMAPALRVCDQAPTAQLPDANSLARGFTCFRFSAPDGLLELGIRLRDWEASRRSTVCLAIILDLQRTK